MANNRKSRSRSNRGGGGGGGGGQRDGQQPPAQQRREDNEVKRWWKVEEIVPETGTFDREAIMQTLHEVEAIGDRMGGCFFLAPMRQRYPDGTYETVGWVIEWRSRAPTVFTQEAAGAPPPEPFEPESQDGRLGQPTVFEEDPDGEAELAALTGDEGAEGPLGDEAPLAAVSEE